MSNTHARPRLTCATAALIACLAPSLAFAVGQAQPAPAAHGSQAMPGHSFDQIDGDRDGRISRTEFAAAHGGKSDRFAGIDSNGDGFISKQEFDAHHAKMKPGAGNDAKPVDEHAGHH